jgi:hypothetical protein
MGACAVLALSSTLYLALLSAGLLLMAAGCWAWFKGGRTNKLALFPYYFLLLNVTSLHAFIKLLSGKKQVMWVPRAG